MQHTLYTSVLQASDFFSRLLNKVLVPLCGGILTFLAWITLYQSCLCWRTKCFGFFVWLHINRRSFLNTKAVFVGGRNVSVSLFDCISTSVGFLIPKQSLLEDKNISVSLFDCISTLVGFLIPNMSLLEDKKIKFSLIWLHINLLRLIQNPFYRRTKRRFRFLHLIHIILRWLLNTTAIFVERQLW